MEKEKDWDLIIKGFKEYEEKCNKYLIKYLLNIFGVGVVCIILSIIIKSIIPIYSIFLISLVTLNKEDKII